MGCESPRIIVNDSGVGMMARITDQEWTDEHIKELLNLGEKKRV